MLNNLIMQALDIFVGFTFGLVACYAVITYYNKETSIRKGSLRAYMEEYKKQKNKIESNIVFCPSDKYKEIWREFAYKYYQDILENEYYMEL